jgi:class 3 adenylate cyclase
MGSRIVWLVVLGDTVNTAAQMESRLAKSGKTYVSEAMVPYLPDGWVTVSRESAGHFAGCEAARSPGRGSGRD